MCGHMDANVAVHNITKQSFLLHIRLPSSPSLIASVFTNLVAELNMAASKESSLSAAHDYLTIRDAFLQSFFDPPANVIFSDFLEYFLHRFLGSERHFRSLADL
uniref:Uncharacterized protein n=1 Tax=Opuntia streptacantha TaxID=393608 RepID=A0A7C9CFE4_OPUST